MEKKTKEELQALYERLPKKIKEVMSSEKTARIIYNVCSKNKLEDSQIPKVSEYVGYILLGIMPIEEMKKNLVLELSVEKEKARQIFLEIYNLIFFPFKKDIDNFYKKNKEDFSFDPDNEKKIKNLGTKDLYEEFCKKKMKESNASKETENSNLKDPYKEPL